MRGGRARGERSHNGWCDERPPADAPRTTRIWHIECSSYDIEGSGQLEEPIGEGEVGAQHAV